jgi:CheY-like chemotaxis protein
MKPEVIEKIFDPYFTTKAVGEGSGLGLSIVHGIVTKSGGVLGVQSEPGRGTTFHTYLPVSGSDVSSDSEPTTFIPTGTERILLVDDEPAIAEVETLMLEKLGYQVETETSSAEALSSFGNNPGGYDLVMTDMTMPGTTGRELSEKMMKIRPDIPIVLCSGYSHQVNKNEAKRMGIRAFVMKPLKLREIAHTIRKVLDESSSGDPL